jgi:outer membrane protein assembly factor BamD
VASYYLKRGAYVAAANRAKQVLTDYPDSPAVEDALWVLVQTYDRLGLTDLKADAERVLKLNFPDSDYLKFGGRKGKEKPWWQIW